jgi:Mn2+/Fe2+ NRAMP family transporter
MQPMAQCIVGTSCSADLLLKIMPTNLIILIAALIVALLVFRALLSLLKTFISTAVALIVIVIILMFFGFTPQDLIQEIINLPQTLASASDRGKKVIGYNVVTVMPQSDQGACRTFNNYPYSLSSPQKNWEI